MKLNQSGNVRLLADFNESPNYGGTLYAHVTVRPVQLASENWSGGFNRPTIAYSLPYEDMAFENVQISCQYDNETSEPYAIETKCTDVTSVGKAKIALALHTAIERQLQKTRTEYGYKAAEGFGQYLIAVCKALNIKHLGVSGYTNWPDGIMWTTPAEGAEAIMYKVSQTFKKDDVTA